jgi:rubrerythrin
MYAEEMEILKRAILNEHEGYQFYRLAAEKVADEEVRDVFEFLAGEEQDHEKWLREIAGDLLRNAAPEAQALPGPDTVSPGIFTRENIKNAGGIIVSALHIGIMMEKASMDYYRDAAQKTRLPAARELYLKLSHWERNHLDRLEKAYDFAREEWWAQQGFSPA